jgi:hypothetical protein
MDFWIFGLGDTRAHCLPLPFIQQSTHPLIHSQKCACAQAAIAFSRAEARFEIGGVETVWGGSVCANRSCRYTSSFAAEQINFVSQQWSSFCGPGFDEFKELLLAELRAVALFWAAPPQSVNFAPITSAKLDSICFAVFDFRTGTAWAEQQVPLSGRSNSNQTIWFVALAKEQLALVTHYGSHGISFG